MKPYGWKPRANEYLGRGVEWLARVVSRRWGRGEGREEVEEQTALLPVGTERVRCLDCGFEARADEDGCCATCGRVCEVWRLAVAYEPEEDEPVTREL